MYIHTIEKNTVTRPPPQQEILSQHFREFWLEQHKSARLLAARFSFFQLSDAMDLCDDIFTLTAPTPPIWNSPSAMAAQPPQLPANQKNWPANWNPKKLAYIQDCLCVLLCDIILSTSAPAPSHMRGKSILGHPAGGKIPFSRLGENKEIPAFAKL